MPAPKLSIHPLTAARWADFEKLFGPRGACGGCWCMLWRLSRAQYEKQKGEANRRAMLALVSSKTPPGLLAYLGNEPVGWCSLGPREAFPGLQRSRLFQPIDDKPVWSVTCLYVARPHRRAGVATALLKAAVRFVGEQGGQWVEGYPQKPRKDPMPDVFAWTGLDAGFRRAGFKAVAWPTPSRPIMRCRAG